MTRYVFALIVVMTYFVGFVLAAPTSDYEYDYDKQWDDTNTSPKPITTTTPTPLRPELQCENTYENFNVSANNLVKEDIQKLMGEYNNWGKLLAPAPVAIGILGQLILMANQINDFPINSGNPRKIFEHIQYPKSFRATLLQISQGGYKAFLLAHRNMDAIRLHNSIVPSDIKDAVRYLMSDNPKIFDLRLPPTLAKIDEVAKKSQDLSKEVVDEFSLVLELILETETAVTASQSGNENRLDDLKLDIELNNQTKIFAEKEDLILQEKDAKMKEMLAKLEYRKDHLYHTTSYGNVKFTINLAKDWVSQIGKNRYNREKKVLHNRKNNWTYTYHEEFIETNLCAQKNSQQLLDLLIAFGQYRTTYEHWQNTFSRRVPFEGKIVINNLERIIGKLENCTEVDSIITKGSELLKKMKNPNTFQSTDKKKARPVENDIDEMVISINNLRNTAHNVTKVTGKKQTVFVKSAWDLYTVSRDSKLEQLNTMSKTVEAIIELNNDLMKIRREKTQQILNRIASLDLSKVHIEQVLRILREGLVELGKLKNDWGNLIQFFDKIRTFIENASRHSTGLVEIIQALRNTSVNSKDKNSKEKDKELVRKELRINFEKSNEAVLLVHGIADMYVKVSNLFIMDRLGKLNTMNSMRIKGVSQEEIIEEKMKLTTDAFEASQGIESYIQSHEKKLNETLQSRHKDIIREFRKIFYCAGKHGLTDRAVNFTGSDWFKIKSRKNGKVIEVSENQVQMWDSNDGDHQLWYLDQENVIRSVVTDFCLTSNGLNKHVTLESCLNNAEIQKWTLSDEGMIHNIDNPDRFLDWHSSKDNIEDKRILLFEVKLDKTNKNMWEMV